MLDILRIESGNFIGNYANCTVQNGTHIICGVNKIKLGNKDFDISNENHHNKISMDCKDGILIFMNGDKMYFHNGILHNINDEPAVIGKNCKFWYKYGILHRGMDFNSYAVELPDATLKWYVDGKLHNDIGPAIIWGYKNHINSEKRDNFEPFGMEFYIQGKLHNEQGPAIEFDNGYTVWAINGNIHKTNGPAVEHGNGNCDKNSDYGNRDYEYYFQGKPGHEDKKIITFLGSPKIKPKSPIIVWNNGDKWFDDGTAVYSNGDYFDGRSFHFKDETISNEIRLPVLQANIDAYFGRKK